MLDKIVRCYNRLGVGEKLYMVWSNWPYIEVIYECIKMIIVFLIK